jgi:hypothetical protein
MCTDCQLQGNLALPTHKQKERKGFGHSGGEPLLWAPQIDPTEYKFKLALLNRQFDAVITMIKGSSLCGSAIIRWVGWAPWSACHCTPRAIKPSRGDMAMVRLSHAI